MINRFERFSVAISNISRYWHKIAAEEMEHYGLKGSHSIYLTTLCRFPEGITAAQFCEACGRDKAEVSRSVALMEKIGLIRKSGSNYRTKLSLTERGLEAAQNVRDRAILAVALAGKGLSEEQRTTFYDALELITHNLQLISEQGLPESNEGELL